MEETDFLKFLTTDTSSILHKVVAMISPKCRSALDQCHANYDHAVHSSTMQSTGHTIKRLKVLTFLRARKRMASGIILSQ